MTHSDKSFVHPFVLHYYHYDGGFSRDGGRRRTTPLSTHVLYMNKRQCKREPQQQAPFFGHNDPIAPFVAVAMGLQVRFVMIGKNEISELLYI